MSDIPMQPVNSSSIASAGYERDTMTMRIEFTSGARYEYYAVPQDVFDRFMQSSSKGTFFQVSIRPCFEFVCVKPRPKKEDNQESHGQSKEEKSKAKQKAAVKARADRNSGETRS